MRPARLLLLVAACGGTSSGPPPVPVQTAISAVAPRASAEDLEVARVDGRPVWASCLAEQATRHKLTRTQALDQCIAFELMAQEAEKRNLAANPEVTEATRVAMVSRFLATTFEATYRTPADLGEFMTKILDKNAWRLSRPDLRSSTYLRIPVAKDAGPDVDAQAKVTAQTITDALARETGLSDPQFVDLARRAVPGVNVEHAEVAAKVYEGLEKTYADALFAVPEVGRIAGPVRTPWGWDVILWTGGLPPKETTRDELAAELFSEVRRAYFLVWVGQLVKAQGVAIETHPEQLADEAAAP